jgi:hypothetical protein
MAMVMKAMAMASEASGRFLSLPWEAPPERAKA